MGALKWKSRNYAVISAVSLDKTMLLEWNENGTIFFFSVGIVGSLSRVCISSKPTVKMQ